MRIIQLAREQLFHPDLTQLAIIACSDIGRCSTQAAKC